MDKLTEDQVMRDYATKLSKENASKRKKLKSSQLPCILARYSWDFNSIKCMITKEQCVGSRYSLYHQSAVLEDNYQYCPSLIRRKGK